MKKFLRFIVVLLAFVGVVISISKPTAAKYFSLEFGDIWDVKFSKYSIFAEEFIVDPNTEKEDANGVYWESVNLWGGRKSSE